MEIAKIVQKQKTVLSDSHLVEFLMNVISNSEHGSWLRNYSKAKVFLGPLRLQ